MLRRDGKILDRKTRLLVAAWSELSERTVERAAELGISALRSSVDRQRLRKAARRLRVEIPETVNGGTPRLDE